MIEKLPLREKLLLTVANALRAPKGFEKKAGQCKRFVRQICEAAGVPPEMCPPPEIDARECANWYRHNWPELCDPRSPSVGDIYFYEIGHGIHGHVGFRDWGNRLAENSTAHAPEGKPDGRGVRPLVKVGKPTLTVRVWRLD